MKKYFLLICAAIFVSACSYSPYNDNYYRSQNSPTHVGKTVDRPELIDCEEASDQLLYRIYTGKGYDPIGHAAFIYDKSFMKDNLSELYEKAVEVKADLVASFLGGIEVFEPRREENRKTFFSLSVEAEL